MQYTFLVLQPAKEHIRKFCSPSYKYVPAQIIRRWRRRMISGWMFLLAIISSFVMPADVQYRYEAPRVETVQRPLVYDGQVSLL